MIFMQNLINFLLTDRFNAFEVFLWCFVAVIFSLWGAISAIKDAEKKKKNAQKVLIDEMHRLYLKETPADNEEKQNALAYLDALNMNPDGKASVSRPPTHDA